MAAWFGRSESGFGPTRKYAAAQQVVGYLGYTGRAAEVVATAAYDSKPPFVQAVSCKAGRHNSLVGGLFDHLVGDRQNPRGNGQAERLGSLQVEDEFEFGRLLDRQVGWFHAL